MEDIKFLLQELAVNQAKINDFTVDKLNNLEVHVKAMNEVLQSCVVKIIVLEDQVRKLYVYSLQGS